MLLALNELFKAKLSREALAEIAQPIGTALMKLVALHGGEHGAKNFGSEDIGKRIVAVFGEPEQQLAAGGMLADEPRNCFLELLDFTFMDEQAGELATELGRDAVEGVPQRVGPMLRICGLE